jgi:hypothetical protein
MFLAIMAMTDATPSRSFDTDPIIALEFGGSNMLIPAPTSATATSIRTGLETSPRQLSRKRFRQTTGTPTVDRLLDPILSESLPLAGARKRDGTVSYRGCSHRDLSSGPPPKSLPAPTTCMTWSFGVHRLSSVFYSLLSTGVGGLVLTIRADWLSKTNFLYCAVIPGHRPHRPFSSALHDLMQTSLCHGNRGYVTDRVGDDQGKRALTFPGGTRPVPSFGGTDASLWDQPFPLNHPVMSLRSQSPTGPRASSSWMTKELLWRWERKSLPSSAM